MPNNLLELEQKRSRLLTGLAQLGDLRPGSVTAIVRRCGKPTCHCAQPNAAGHGPTIRLTYKAKGKTISEALPTLVSVRKAEREIAEFRKFEELSRSFIETNEQICRLRPIAEPPRSEQEKKRRTPSSKRSRAK